MTTNSPRPFYFMVPFWGQRYREYFVDTCLPSLLAPGNLPLLQAADGHRFLIATTKSDWNAIERLPIMEKLRAYATPILIEIQEPDSATAPGGRNAINYQNLCQKRLVETAYQYRGYGCLLSPDIIISDGMIAALLRWAQEGYQLVLCPALRQAEEGVRADLFRDGYLRSGERPSLSGRAIAIPPRRVGELLVRHLHPEVLAFEEGNPGRPFLPPFRFWRVPGGRGIILHTFFGLPVLMDYAAVESHDSACLDHGAFENVYLGRNFSHCDRVHIVEDSDEFGILSVTPSPSQAGRPAPTPRRRLDWMIKLAQTCSLRESMAFYARRNRDVVKRNLFRVAVRWHTADLDAVWQLEERQVSIAIERALGDYPMGTSAYFPHFPVSLARLLGEIHFAYLLLPATVRLPISTLWLTANAIFGDRNALDHLRRRMTKLNAAIRGKFAS